MKKGDLLNQPLSAAIAGMGHTQTLTLADAGLPVPRGPERIDLAVLKGVPGFITVLKAIATELRIEKIEFAKEMGQTSPAFATEFAQAIEEIAAAQGQEIDLKEISHDLLKMHSAESIAVVRTGECTPYANAIIYSGVKFG